MTRQKHLEWCKKRALEYIDAGDCNQALASMLSDLNKHEETRNHAGSQLGVMLLFGGHLSSPEEMSDFINGFN